MFVLVFVESAIDLSFPCKCLGYQAIFVCVNLCKLLYLLFYMVHIHACGVRVWPEQSQVSISEDTSNLDHSVPIATHQKDADTGSVGTIYESIDNLVLQFDNALRQIGENMGRDGKPSGKKEHSLTKQSSFSLSRNKSTKSKLLTEKKAELEKGERFSGYMMKKSNNGTWKKRWCVLKGCVFGYYK